VSTTTAETATTAPGRLASWLRPRLSTVVMVVVAGTFTVFLVYPLLRLLFDVFVGGPGAGLEPIREAFALDGIGKTLLNTAIVVAGSTVAASVIALVFAWLNERTDARLGFLAEIMPLTPLLVPAIASTIGWVFLLAPRSGIANVLIRDALGLVGIHLSEGPFNVFSFWGLIALYTLLLIPYVYLPVSAALARLDPSLEEASRVAGVGPFRSLVKVTLPSIKPAIVGGMLVAVVMGISTFSVPVIVGTGAGVEILSVRIYRLLTFAFPPQIAPAVALSMLILLTVGALSVVQRRILRSGAFATIGGKGIRPNLVALGRWRWAARGVMLLFVACASIVPLLGLVYVSLRGFWTAEVTFSGLDLDNYRAVFDRRVTSKALTNSIQLAATCALAGMAVATVMALFVGTRNGPLSRFVDFVAKAPGGLSHIVLAVAFLGALAGPPFRLSGTLTLLLLAYIVLYMPQAYLSAGSAYSQLGTELGEASAVAGARPWRTFRKVTFPLMLPGLAGGAVVLFVLIMSDVTASALLSGGGTPVVGFVVLDLWSDGTFPMIAALGTVMTLVTSAVTILLMYFGKGRAVARP